ncbi:unnamed protein product [Cylicocyclus nassatus]|uniref:Uncharacterized protein n=1 Tax=Cylicocyclus nassatus TaxID=53992 RepID=A0AA36DSB8_CYLNA|nr:unnamed protein product [Cylicocyclus nassatus]
MAMISVSLGVGCGHVKGKYQLQPTHPILCLPIAIHQRCRGSNTYEKDVANNANKITVIAMLLHLVLFFLFPPLYSTQCCCCRITSTSAPVYPVPVPVPVPVYPPMGGGMMGGGMMGSGFGLGGFPDYGPLLYGTGSPWAAGGGLIGNGLAFLFG